MRYFILTLALLFGFASTASAQSSEIKSVIEGQIEAFRADDFGAAFEFASPNIRGIFRTPENFGVMVREGYPMVWRPGELRFLELRDIGGKLWQKLLIRDAKGAIFILDYQMIEGDSGWKINAVQLLQAPDVGA